MRLTDGTAPTSYQFIGQRNDTAIGLYFYNARYYDPSASYRTRANFEFSSDPYHAVAEQMVRSGHQIIREYTYQTARDNLIR